MRKQNQRGNPNGVYPLGVAFDGVRNLDPNFGYFPAISLSQGERCDLNFGSRTFKYPIEGFLPIQAPPKTKDGEHVALVSELTTYLLKCLTRLVKLYSQDPSTSTSVEKLRRLKRVTPRVELLNPIGNEISKQFFSLLDGDIGKQFCLFLVSIYSHWCVQLLLLQFSELFDLKNHLLNQLLTISTP